LSQGIWLIIPHPREIACPNPQNITSPGLVDHTALIPAFTQGTIAVKAESKAHSPIFSKS